MKKFNNKVGYYAKGLANNFFNSLMLLNFSGLGCDSANDLMMLLRKKNKGFIQGNFDESKMLLNKNDLEDELSKYCESLLKLDVEDFVNLRVFFNKKFSKKKLFATLNIDFF